MGKNSRRSFGIAATPEYINACATLLKDLAEHSTLSKADQAKANAAMIWIAEQARDVPGFQAAVFAQSIAEIAINLKKTLVHLLRDDPRADLNAFKALEQIALCSEDDVATIAIKGLRDAQAFYEENTPRETDGDRIRRTMAITAIISSLRKIERDPYTHALFNTIRNSQQSVIAKQTSIRLDSIAPVLLAYHTARKPGL